MTTLPAKNERLRREATPSSLAEEHLDDVYGYLLYLTGDPALAEDLTSETFERALRRWRRFDPRRASARTWLCQLARSTALDHFRSERRRKRREEAFSRPARTETEVQVFEGLSPELDGALRRLTPAEREVVALRVVLDFDAASAARLLGISPTACATRLSRALRKLEEMMADDRA